MLYEGLRSAAEKKGWSIEGDSALREALVSMPITITGREGDVPVQLLRASALHTFSTNAFIKPAIASPFDISTEGVTGAIAHALGIEDVEIGDDGFDREFRLVSKDPDALKKLLTPHVRAVVEELAAETKAFGSHFRITESVVWLQRPCWGTMTEEEVLRDIPLCVRAVKTIQAAAQAANLT